MKMFLFWTCVVVAVLTLSESVLVVVQGGSFEELALRLAIATAAIFGANALRPTQK